MKSHVITTALLSVAFVSHAPASPTFQHGSSELGSPVHLEPAIEIGVEGDVVAHVQRSRGRTAYLDSSGRMVLSDLGPEPRGIRPAPVSSTGNVGGTTLQVPGSFPTIQEAMDAAAPGDTVLVAPGIYVENIEFPGIPITVESSGGPDVTIIDGNQAGSVVRINMGEGRETVLSGFTLRNGRATFGFSLAGGGISINGASPTIVGNIIADNSACAGGGGIELGFSSALIIGNVIRGNTRQGCSGGSGGGGIQIRGAANAEIIDNEIYENTWNGGAAIELFAAGTPLIQGNVLRSNDALNGRGGAIRMFNFSDATVVNNSIYGNEAGQGGGIYWLVPSSANGPRIANNTVVGNNAVNGSAIFAEGFDGGSRIENNVLLAPMGQSAIWCDPSFNPTNPTVRFNDVFAAGGPPYGGSCPDQTGIDGNISIDPMLTGAMSGDMRLRALSPCIDAGDSGAVPSGVTLDIGGDQRFLDDLLASDTGIAPGNLAVVDMGANEHDPVLLDVSFEADVLGSPLQNGLEVSSQSALWNNVTISATSASGLQAAVFDSSPMGPNAFGGDPDLLVGLGNVLILQEDPTQSVAGIFDSPDDDANGGLISFEFATGHVFPLSIDLIDICPSFDQDARVILTDSLGRTRTYTIPTGWTEDVAVDGPLGFRTLDLSALEAQPGFLSTATATEDPDFDPILVSRIDVELDGSGAVDNFLGISIN